MDEGNVSRGRFVPSSAAQLASLFHADEDYSSDSDQEHAYSHNHRGRDDALRGGSTQRIDSSSPASQAANILLAAAALRGSFPSPPGGRGAKGDDEELAQPARAATGGRKKHVPGGVLAGPPPNSANGSPVGSPETGNIRKGSCPVSNRRSSNVNSNVCGNSKTGGSNSRSNSKVKTLPSGKDRDIEAARQTPETSRATSVAASEFELNKDRNPAEWMRVGSTTGIAFLLYTLVSQAALACSSFAFLNSAEEDQLSWKTACSGIWTSISDAGDDGFIEFDTHVGWKYYGTEGEISELGDISRSAAIIGSLTGIAHTLIVILSFVFFTLALCALCLSCPCCHSGSSGDGGGGSDKKDCPPPKRVSPLVLGYDCHRWMFTMAGVDVLAGVWCFGLGCVGFYLVVAGEFTSEIEELLRSWGDDVSCSTATTNPRYGFIANGISVLLLLGGGVISFARAKKSDRELDDTVREWERGRAKAAEMSARLAMARKKEEYAAAAVAAARAAVASESAGTERGTAIGTNTPLPSPLPQKMTTVDLRESSSGGQFSLLEAKTEGFVDDDLQQGGQG